MPKDWGMYSFQITDKNNGPVEYITVMYGKNQCLSYACKDSMTFKKKVC